MQQRTIGGKEKSQKKTRSKKQLATKNWRKLTNYDKKQLAINTTRNLRKLAAKYKSNQKSTHTNRLHATNVILQQKNNSHWKLICKKKQQFAAEDSSQINITCSKIQLAKKSTRLTDF